MKNTKNNRRNGLTVSAEKVKLVFLSLLFIFGLVLPVKSAVNITNYASDLTATFDFVPMVGVTNKNISALIITSNTVTTNYDFVIANTNSGTNQMEFGQTNYFSLFITNTGGEGSRSDYLFLSLSLLNTNEPGYTIQTYYDANTNGFYDAGDRLTNII